MQWKQKVELSENNNAIWNEHKNCQRSQSTNNHKQVHFVRNGFDNNI